ncbi:MAG: hypothetical protein ACREDR_31855 [Blastocatellia bacterium]
MSIKSPFSLTGFGFVLLLTFLCVTPPDGYASRGNTARSANDRSVTILVTAHPHNKKDKDAAANLKTDDFAVKENGRQQQVLSAKPASEAPLIVEILIQDNLSSRMDNEIDGIKQFIRDLPEGSRVLTGYITTGTLDVRQDFTTERDQATRSLRVLNRRAPYNPYVEVLEGLKKFDSQPDGRRIIVLISDGLDTSHGFEDANPDESTDLSRAIKEAQNRGVAVFSVFAPSAHPIGRLEIDFGQGSLIKLSDDTGGEAFVGPVDLVSLSPYLSELKASMANQWLLTYQSTSSGKGFRRIEVSTETGVHLHHEAGYWAK